MRLEEAMKVVGGGKLARQHWLDRPNEFPVGSRGTRACTTRNMLIDTNGRRYRDGLESDYDDWVILD